MPLEKWVKFLQKLVLLYNFIRPPNETPQAWNWLTFKLRAASRRNLTEIWHELCLVICEWKPTEFFASEEISLNGKTPLGSTNQRSVVIFPSLERYSAAEIHYELVIALGKGVLNESTLRE